MINKGNKLPVWQQCQLLKVNRSRFYYKAKSKDDSCLANVIADYYKSCPVYGYRRITACLRRDGYKINPKCVLRIMKDIGLKAIYPGIKTTVRNKEHDKYSYALQDIVIVKPRQAWQIDITYLRTEHGFIYLNALIDMHSRYVVGWTLSNSLDTESCLRTLEKAISEHGKPAIINSDQGSQFTCCDWVNALHDNGIIISMNGKGRSNDNAYIERLWRTLKYESVILNVPRTVVDYKKLLPEFINWYNEERPHQALKYKTPAEVLYEKTLQNMVSTNSAKYVNNSAQQKALLF